MASSKATHGFGSWAEVVQWVKERGSVYYHAPLDVRPVFVRALLVEHEGYTFVRVLPDRSDVSPFHADAGHLPRFRKKTG